MPLASFFLAAAFISAPGVVAAAPGVAWVRREPAPGPAPAARASGMMAYDSWRRVTVLVGGETATLRSGNYDTWKWDGTQWTIGPYPNEGVHLFARLEAAMVFDAARGRMVLFGGHGAWGFDDTWEWDGGDEPWSQVTAGDPGERYGIAMAYDRARALTVLFGAPVDSLEYDLTATWTWDGALWVSHATPLPPYRNFHAMAYDSSRGRTVLFGGQTAGEDDDNTWEWDGTAWQEATAAAPPPRSRHAMAFDARRGKTVLFGGQGITFETRTDGYADTWEWDGVEWRELAIAGPRGRWGHVMAYDEARGRVVLFGGEYVEAISRVFLDDLWELVGVGDPCGSTAECDSGYCVDGVCCATACGTCERCDAPDAEGTCTAVREEEDPDSCTGATACDAAGNCRVQEGHSCADAPAGVACYCDGGASGTCAAGSCACGGDGGIVGPLPRGCDCRAGGAAGTSLLLVLGLLCPRRRRRRE